MQATRAAPAAEAVPESQQLRLVSSNHDLKATLFRIVEEAQECLVATGSRSRDFDYPAYRLPDDSDVVTALRDEAARSLGRRLPLAVVGPSNIGNYLASMGIPPPSRSGLRLAGPSHQPEVPEIALIVWWKIRGLRITVL